MEGKRYYTVLKMELKTLGFLELVSKNSERGLNKEEKKSLANSYLKLLEKCYDIGERGCFCEVLGDLLENRSLLDRNIFNKKVIDQTWFFLCSLYNLEKSKSIILDRLFEVISKNNLASSIFFTHKIFDGFYRYTVMDPIFRTAS